MNTSDLIQKLDFISNSKGKLQMILYACLPGNVIRRMDVKSSDIPPLLGLFIKHISDKITKNLDYTLALLSTADSRSGCFYKYDLELPKELIGLKSVLESEDIPDFSFHENKVSEIEALIAVIADNTHKISLYKRLSAIEVLGRGGYMLWKSGHRFERFEEHLLRISGSFQVLCVESDVFVLKLETIEKMIGFTDVIKREATLGLDAIRKMEIVKNFEDLKVLVDDLRLARKLIKVARCSPVINSGIPNNRIIEFSKTHPAVRGKMKYANGGSQFILRTKTSRELFLKILNDDYLTSELTRLHYESLAKDNVEHLELESQ